MSERPRFRFSVGELCVVFVLGVIMSAYGLLALLLLGKCTCAGPVELDARLPAGLIQWGSMVIAMWVVAIAVMVARGRNR